MKKATNFTTQSRSTSISKALEFITIPLNALLFLILPISSKLSRWAQNNPIMTRILIGVCHVLAVFNAIFLGMSLYFLDIGTSKLLLWSAGLLVGLCFLLYPLKSQAKFSYVKQRMLDFSFVMLYTACIALSLNNSLEADSTSYTSSIDQPQAVFVVNSAHKNQSPTKKNGFAKAKEKFQHFKANLKNQKGSPNKRKAVIVMIFTILVAIVLSLGTAIGACILACSGYTALTIAAIAVGAGLVFIVFFFGLRRFKYHRDNHYYTHGNEDEDSGERKKKRRNRRNKSNEEGL